VIDEVSELIHVLERDVTPVGQIAADVSVVRANLVIGGNRGGVPSGALTTSTYGVPIGSRDAGEAR
jgi:hypothetical protein